MKKRNEYLWGSIGKSDVQSVNKKELYYFSSENWEFNKNILQKLNNNDWMKRDSVSCLSFYALWVKKLKKRKNELQTISPAVFKK